MQSSRWLGVLAAMAAFAAGPALAGTAPFRGEATLATPAAAPAQQTINGVAWACDGAACVGEAAHGTLDGLVRQCKKVAAAFGPVTAYASGGREADKSQLKACNRAAAGVQTATN